MTSFHFHVAYEILTRSLIFWNHGLVMLSPHSLAFIDFVLCQSSHRCHVLSLPRKLHQSLVVGVMMYDSLSPAGRGSHS